MSRQYFEDMPVEPLNIVNAAVNFATAIQVLFPNTSQIAIPALDVRPGKVWRLTAGGIMTTPTTGTLTITPCWGTGTTVTLGPSIAQTYQPSLSNVAWMIHALMICRGVGFSGANSTFIAQGVFQSAGIAATAGSSSCISFGGTQSAICDPTAGGFQICMTFSVTAAAMTPQIVCLQSLN
jgi:hypothetical protein